MRIKQYLFISALLLGLHSGRAQTPLELNLGFEQAGEKRSKPNVWTVSGDGFASGASGYEVRLDEAVAKSGKRSLRMKGTGSGGFGNAYLEVPADSAAGKRAKISAGSRRRTWPPRGTPASGAGLMVPG